MNLNDAFRAQNKLQTLMDEASDILQDRSNTLKVTATHLRSKVMPETQNAVVEDSAPSEYAEHINQVPAFLMAMLVEREKLSAASYDSKAKLPGYGQRDRSEPGAAAACIVSHVLSERNDNPAFLPGCVKNFIFFPVLLTGSGSVVPLSGFMIAFVQITGNSL